MPDTSIPTTTCERDEARRGELAAFLKARRAAIAPARVGLRAGLRRRARGLLREEVAQLAGISATWYEWLEQGRDIRPSRECLGQLADALLLGESERTHLFTLAQPDLAATSLSTRADDRLCTFIAGLRDQPAYVVNGVWDLLAWNDAASELFGDLARVPERERNVLYMLFCWAPWRELLVDRAAIAASAAAQFRSDTARYTGHQRLVELLAAMTTASPEFAALWEARAVHAPALYAKRLAHPKLGLRTLTYAPLKPRGAAEDVSVVVYSPVTA